jgi:O-antigen/teichoic acid export membrane protein
MLVFGVTGVINRALGFFLIPVYTYYVRPREYGILAILMIILGAIPLILRMGLGNALLRSWYDYEENDRPILATTVFIFLLITSIPILLLFAYFSSETSAYLFESNSYSQHLQLIYILAFLEIFNVVPDTLLRLRNASIQYSICQTVGFIFQLTINISLVVYWEMGIKGILIANLIGAILENGLMFSITLSQMKFGFNVSELKKMLVFGTPLIFGRLSAICFQWIDRFFLKYYTDLRQVGLYTLGNQLTTPISLLVSMPFGMIWANMQVSVMNDKDAKEYYARMLTYVVYGSSFLALGLSILVEDVLRIFATAKYWEAATIVPLLALAAVFDVANPTLGVGISLLRKSYFSPIIVAVAALSNILLNALLIPRMGMTGAAIATLISYIIISILRYVVSDKLLHIDYEWGRVAKIGILVAIIFTCSKLIIIERPIISFIVKFPLTLVLPFLLIFVNFYDEKEKSKIKEIINNVIERYKSIFTKNKKEK